MSEPAEVQTAFPYQIQSPEGKPVSIHLNSAVLQDIQRPAEANVRRGVETGGLLLGFARPAGDRWMVVVEGVQQLPVEHRGGESWRIGEHDRRALNSALRSRSRDRSRDQPYVVGWYRTHTRPGLYLDQADFRLFADCFPPPANVAMLVSGNTGGFFFWEGGEIQRSRPYMTFDLPAKAAKAAPAPAGQSSTRRQLWLAAPVVAGIVLGLLWNPNPLRRSSVEVSEIASNDPARLRAAFSPPPVPAQASEERDFTPTPDVPPSAATARKLVRAAPPKPKNSKMLKRLQLPVVNRQVAKPLMETESRTEVAAVRQDVPVMPDRSEPLVQSIMEPSEPSGIRRVVGSIPGFGFLKRRKPAGEDERFTPARVLEEVRPISPHSLAEEVPVRVRVLLNAEGEIHKAELLTRSVEPAIARAAMEAAKHWRFEPARVDEKPVASELVVYFRFPAATAAGGS